jgi:tRNA pseudouridine55 synthase
MNHGMHHEVTGFLLISKPLAATSFGCIKIVRRALSRALDKKSRVGHAGTLDPYATGLLIIAIGRVATRRLDELSGLQKEYVATIKLGEQTDSLDIEGTVIKTCPFEQLRREDIAAAIASFGSAYHQVPPAHSALKHEGQNLYNLVRKKKMPLEQVQEIAVKKAKLVQLHAIDLLSFELPFFKIHARVSHGTYIRSLVRDIAQQAGSCATMVELERSAIGPFRLQEAVSIVDIETIEDVKKHLISVDDFFARMNS